MSQPADRLGPFISMVNSAIKDSWRFLLLGTFLIFGYSAAFEVLSKSGFMGDDEESFQSLPRAIETLLYACLGNFEVDVGPRQPPCHAFEGSCCVDADVSFVKQLPCDLGQTAVRFLHLLSTDRADQSADRYLDRYLRQSPIEGDGRTAKTATPDRSQEPYQSCDVFDRKERIVSSSKDAWKAKPRFGGAAARALRRVSVSCSAAIVHRSRQKRGMQRIQSHREKRSFSFWFPKTAKQNRAMKSGMADGWRLKERSRQKFDRTREAGRSDSQSWKRK